MSIETVLRFAQLGLSAPILQAVDEVGYESPSPIQARSIPPMLAGRDLLGQAQTGTGKTAAFALPILCRIDPHLRSTQALVLTPTRELAIQVAEAIHSYARHLDGVHVLPIYGGQNIGVQLRPLQRGVHVVVGTPGRIIDHLERGTLKLDAVATVVLDEADEMLRMGFIEDVDRILQEAPATKQVALFSATLPAEVRRIADRHLKDPEVVTIESATTTVETVKQRYLIATWRQKLDAMTRILETTDFNAMLIFVRTKVATLELSEKLEARGHACAALNGDMTQALRERVVQRLRDGSLDIVVATDVAARGLDVSRISHVVNYDIPNDTEAYVHRIGRTARAGREGEAILLVQPRERHMLRAIEKATNQPIGPMQLPSAAAVTDRRVALFKQSVHETIESQDLRFFAAMLGELSAERGHPMERIAAALAFIVQQERPLQAPGSSLDQGESGDRKDRKAEWRDERSRDAGPERFAAAPRPGAARPSAVPSAQEGKSSYRVEVGSAHGVEPKHLVGAITNEVGLTGRDVGRITVHETYSVVDLPSDLPAAILRQLQTVEIFGRILEVSVLQASSVGHAERRGGGAPEKPGGSAKAKWSAKPDKGAKGRVASRAAWKSVKEGKEKSAKEGKWKPAKEAKGKGKPVKEGKWRPAKEAKAKWSPAGKPAKGKPKKAKPRRD